MGHEQTILRARPLKQTFSEADSNPHPRRSFLAPLAVLLLLLAAWAIRDTKLYELGDDVGYYLGVIGGVMMLVLLLYSLRKHIGFMRNWGATKHWFRFHMTLGILGPSFILIHSKFHVGSINATVALSCMLLVAGSGIIGRVIYRKIHHGLYGRSATLQEVQTRLGIAENDVRSRFHFARDLLQRLKDFEVAATSPTQGFWHRILTFTAVGLRARWTYYSVSREMDRLFKSHAEKSGWDEATLERRMQRGRKLFRRHLDSVVDVARFTAYERLFSLWHVLHVPFVFMLVISGIAHVIAVHMY